MLVLFSLLFLIFLVAVWVAWLFNKLVRSRSLVRDAWAGIDVQLVRRAGLVPNLVAVVQAYQVHERTTLEDVVRARARLEEASGPRASGQADSGLDSALHQLVAVVEAYPALKADQHFLGLQEELSTLEEDIAFARRYYNATARTYNIAQESFPAVLIARFFGHNSAEYFKAEEDARRAVSTDFAADEMS